MALRLGDETGIADTIRIKIHVLCFKARASAWWVDLGWLLGDSDIPSGYVKIAIENAHRNSGFSHWKWWFSIVMLVYQRVQLMFFSYCLLMRWTKIATMAREISSVWWEARTEKRPTKWPKRSCRASETRRCRSAASLHFTIPSFRMFRMLLQVFV